MLLTLWCIFIALGSPILFGVPLSWLLQGRKPLDEWGWVQAPFLGIAAVVIVLQNLVYLDVPVRLAAPALWLICGMLWLWFVRSTQLRASMAACPYWVFGAVLLVYALQGVGLLIVGAKYYVGRAWSDQFSYTVMTQFMADERLSTTAQAFGNQPVLLRAIELKDERIGQSILQAFFAVSSFTDAKTLFEPTILLSPGLIVVAIYMLLRGLNLDRRRALLASTLAGVLPSITLLHLESFQSHALVLPLLICFPAILLHLNKQPDRYRLAIAALILTVSTSIYTEFLPILVGVVILTISVAAIYHTQRYRLIACYGVLLLSPALLVPGMVSSMPDIVTRINYEVLIGIYPWAYELESLSRIWFGDLAVAPQIAARGLIDVTSVVLTAMAGFGLLHACLPLVTTRGRILAMPEQGNVLVCLLSVCAIALLPVIIIAKDHTHPYQFYKLLISVSPLLVVGIALLDIPIASVPMRAVSWSDTTLGAWRYRIVSVILLLIFFGCVVSTTSMGMKSTLVEAQERSAAHFLIAPDVRELQDRLEQLSDQDLLLTDTRSPTSGWIAYFARHNRIWLPEPYVGGIDLAPIATNVTLQNIPSDLLVLYRNDDMFLRSKPDPKLWPAIWSIGEYTLAKPVQAAWVVPVQIKNKNGLESLKGHPFFWMGKGDTYITVLASESGLVSIEAEFQAGPSLPGQSSRQLLVIAGSTYHRHISLANASATIAVPVQAGQTQIVLRPLDRVTVDSLSSGEQRPLLIGAYNMTVHLSNAPVIVEQIQNQNGLEEMDGTPFFWMGQGDTIIDVVTAYAGTLRLSAELLPGANIPYQSERNLLLELDTGYHRIFTVYGGPNTITIPVPAGASRIQLRPLDQPLEITRSDGETRPLILGVHNLTVQLDAYAIDRK